MNNPDKFTIRDGVLAVITFLFFPLLVGLVKLSFWWSEYVNGVEPKTGQGSYDFKEVDGVQYRRHAGFRYHFSKWQKVPEAPPCFGNMDLVSLYPHVIHTV